LALRCPVPARYPVMHTQDSQQTGTLLP